MPVFWLAAAGVIGIGVAFACHLAPSTGAPLAPARIAALGPVSAAVKPA